jgi:hypothetical protein
VFSIWSLPGPARFATAITARLDRGHSVVVGLPAWAAEDGAFLASLLSTVDYGVDVVDDCENGSRPLASLVADRFSINDVQPGPAAAAALAGHVMLRGRVLAITVASDDQQSARWTEFVRAFLPATRAVPMTERPQLVLLARKTCAGALTGTDALLDDLWWWGVLDRLDTAFYVKSRFANGHDGQDGLIRETITEVAGFDLNLADHLSAGWDGSPGTLASALATFVGPCRLHGQNGPTKPHQLPHSSTALSAPPMTLLPMWDQGLVDRWDAFPAYLHACAITDPADLRSRVWRAQVRTLMPLIDEERIRIGAWLRREIRGLPDEAVLEPAGLFNVLQDHPSLKTWRGGHRKRLIYWLRDARNTLAHMGTLTPGEIDRGQRLIVQDRHHS